MAADKFTTPAGQQAEMLGRYLGETKECSRCKKTKGLLAFKSLAGRETKMCDGCRENARAQASRRQSEPAHKEYRKAYLREYHAKPTTKARKAEWRRSPEARSRLSENYRRYEASDKGQESILRQAARACLVKGTSIPRENLPAALVAVKVEILRIKRFCKEQTK